MIRVSQSRSEGGTLLTLNRLSSDGTIQEFRKDGTTIGSIGVQFSDNLYISGNSNHAGLAFGTNLIYPSDTSGSTADNEFDLGFSTGRFKNLYLSGGVYLGGTGSANLLDDYEEGTFTPTYTTDGTDFDSVTYDALTSAKYVKIGSMVHVQLIIRTDNITVGSATGNVYIGGLPFTSSSGIQADSSAELTVGQTASWAGDVPFVAEVLNNTQTARLWYRTAVNGSTSNVAIADLGTGADSNLIRVSGSYIAA